MALQIPNYQKPNLNNQPKLSAPTGNTLATKPSVLSNVWENYIQPIGRNILFANKNTPSSPVGNYPVVQPNQPTIKNVTTNPSASNPTLATPAAKEYISNSMGSQKPEIDPTILASNTAQNNINTYGDPSKVTPIDTNTLKDNIPTLPKGPSAYDTAKADYTKAYEDYIQTLNPSPDVTKAQTNYNDYVANANASISGLEGQGRGIPLNLIRGQQAKLRDQALQKESLLQGDITIAQGNQTQRQNVGAANVSLKEKLLGLERGPNDLTGLPASAQEYEYAKKNGYTSSFNDYQNEDANRKAVQAGTATDASSVAEGITSGLIPPDLSKNVSFKDRTAVNAILSKNGYNLTKAQEDWTATNKYLATLNGSQQVRLRQAVNQVSETLPLVEQLAGQWNGGQFPILNKANLKLAKGGAYGAQAQSVATQLEAEIADLTSELGTVYKGGNSSTDESLKLAASQLSADWSKQTMLDAIALAKKNIQYRKNSITNTGVGGIDNTSNTYAPSSSSSSSETGFNW